MAMVLLKKRYLNTPVTILISSNATKVQHHYDYRYVFIGQYAYVDIYNENMYSSNLNKVP